MSADRADAIRREREAVEQLIDAEGLYLVTMLRDAADDFGMSVSAPGEAEPGEFYLTTDGGNSYAVKVEYLG